jgi:hypothetical protein
MSSLLEEPAQTAAISPVQRLRSTMAAVRLSFTWFGTRKTLSPAQKAQAAESCGAEGELLSAGKKLIDTRDPAFKAVTAVRGRSAAYWKGISLPYPEPGVRLIRQDDIAAFDVQLTSLKAELNEAVGQLNERYGTLKTAARERLGSLYNPADYPESLQGLFDVAWDYPSVEPPPYLQQLSPELYRMECQRVAARFEEAIRLAEQAFQEELSQLISHLTERLSGADDANPKCSATLLWRT